MEKEKVIRKRDKIIIKILNGLENGGKVTADIIDIFTSSYGSSYRKLRARAYGSYYKNKKSTSDKSLGEEYYELQKFYSVLNKLKREGFIKKEQKNRGISFWKITKKGKEKLDKKYYVKNDYKKEKDNGLNIIIFDIPEKEREKRAWLRSVLEHLGFSMLQNSVWVGQYKIPKSLIKDLKERDMLNYVHIFKVLKRGTI